MTEANWQIDVKRRETCATCKYFKRWEEQTPGNNGDCRRFPPHVLTVTDLCIYPVVSESDWCGEYKRF